MWSLSVCIATGLLLWCSVSHHVTSSPTNNKHWNELLEVLDEIQEDEIMKNGTWSVYLNSSSAVIFQNATNAGNMTIPGLENGGDEDGDDIISLIHGALFCNFDQMAACPFSQDIGDSTDWTVGEGATPTYMTGPSYGHGYTGKYIYLEATGLAAGNNAILLSSILAASTRCVKFSYHMFRSHTGILKVMRMYSMTSMLPVWARSGNQGNTWHTSEMTVTASQSFQIAFEAVRGTGFSSDIALDDISISPGACGQAATTPTTATTLTSSTIVPSGTNTVFTCDFDDNTMCAFNQRSDDDFDWQLSFASSSSINTGPQGDQSGTGLYLLMEASEPRVKGDVAKIQSRDIKLSSCSSGCLSFWYHISGRTPSMLRVSKTWTSAATQHDVPLWLSDESTSTKWRHATVSLSQRETFKIVFSGHVNGWEGDIAIYDVTLTHGACLIA